MLFRLFWVCYCILVCLCIVVPGILVWLQFGVSLVCCLLFVFVVCLLGVVNCGLLTDSWWFVCCKVVCGVSFEFGLGDGGV